MSSIIRNTATSRNSNANPPETVITSYSIHYTKLYDVTLIRNGFGSTLGYIGIVIIAGTIIGTILEKTGAALSMTQVILKLVGKQRAPLAMSIAGYVVSIPVFCDSGYVILTPLNKALSAKTGTSMSVMAVALATGLYATSYNFV